MSHHFFAVPHCYPLLKEVALFVRCPKCHTYLRKFICISGCTQHALAADPYGMDVYWGPPADLSNKVFPKSKYLTWDSFQVELVNRRGLHLTLYDVSGKTSCCHYVHMRHTLCVGHHGTEGAPTEPIIIIITGVNDSLFHFKLSWSTQGTGQTYKIRFRCAAAANLATCHCVLSWMQRPFSWKLIHALR